MLNTLGTGMNMEILPTARFVHAVAKTNMGRILLLFNAQDTYWE